MFPVTAKAKLNLTLCTNLKMIKYFQLLFSSFATQNSIQTTKSVSLWEVIQLAVAIPSSTSYMAGQMLSIRMINGLILAVLGYKDSRLGIRTTYSKLYRPE